METLDQSAGANQLNNMFWRLRVDSYFPNDEFYNIKLHHNSIARSGDKAFQLYRNPLNRS